MQWMQREQGRGEGARPCLRRRAPEEHVQQHAVGRVQQDVRQVMRPRSNSEEPAVHHVRQPCERMPVSVAKRPEGPEHVPDGRAAAHVRVAADIVRVVEIDEIERGGLDEHREDGQRKAGADQQVAASHGGSGLSCPSGGGCQRRARGAPTARLRRAMDPTNEAQETAQGASAHRATRRCSSDCAG